MTSVTNASAIAIAPVAAPGARPPSRTRTRLEATAAFAAFALAGIWVVTALIAIANFGFRYPAFDQLRFYHFYLDLPFPQNLLYPQNGHRPILPVLLRLAEIRWFSADQLLQLSIGSAAAVGAWLLIVATIIRERGLALPSRAAACVIATLAIFWLGNARVLMHGNELAHVYFVMLGLVAALLAVHRAAADRQASRWMAIAAIGCLLATFSFGPGIVTFVAALLVAAILRIDWKKSLAPFLVLLAAVGIYLLALPQSDHVLGQLRVEPATDLLRTLRWLAAPWLRAGLGYANPPIETSLLASPPFQHNLGAGIVGVAQWIADRFGGDWIMREGAVVGLLGGVIYAAMLVHAIRRGRALRAMASLALGIASFALITGVLVCVNRAAQFDANAMQVYADRYLPWSCLFWCGVVLYAIDATSSRWRNAALAHLLIAITAAALLLPSHRATELWSASVYRNIAQAALAGMLDIWDPQRLPDNADARRADVVQTFDALRRQSLSMFAEPAHALWRDDWTAPGELPPAIGAARVDRTFSADVLDGHGGSRRVAAFEGALPLDFALPRDAILVVSNDDGRLCGLAKFDFLIRDEFTTRWTVPVKHGFDGYVIAAEPGQRLHVLVLDRSRNVLANVALNITPGV